MHKNILIIEDDDSLREGLNFILTDEKFNVLALSDGYNALKKAEKFKPDIFVIDYRLPGPNGLSISKNIRQSKSLGHTPIIIISASGQNLEPMVKQAGANILVKKPFEVDQLLDVIKNNLN
jgi:DNA-binding response OmpR family regulator